MYPMMPSIKGRSDEIAVKRAASIARINELRPDITIYTDGSADGGCRQGGSAAVITSGDAEDPVKLHVIRTKGAAYTTSCEEECQALKDAIDWAAIQNPDRILICTDSQSNCHALMGFGEETNTLREKIMSCPSDIIIQWIPGHSDIPGNDMADYEANMATKEAGEGRPISWAAAKTIVKTVITEKEIEHPRIKEAYAFKSKSKEGKISNRKDQVELARLRAGHHLGFMVTRHRYNEREDPSCPRCREESTNRQVEQPLFLDNVEHWLECEATAAARMKDFGRVTVGLGILTEEPMASLAHAGRTLRGAQWASPTPR